jgi:hypothetical protein
VTDVADRTETPVACTPPIATVAPAVNPLPVIVMVVPPPVVPRDGETEVTVTREVVGPVGDEHAGSTTAIDTRPRNACRRTRAGVLTDETIGWQIIAESPQRSVNEPA